MIEFVDWGVIDYRIAFDRQKQLVTEATAQRGLSRLILCEHPSVITIGRSGSTGNIVRSAEFLRSAGIETIETDRGGDVTLHNPGQIVGYPIFDLTAYRTDLHWFLREIEECVIEVLASYGIGSGRVDGLTGVWVESNRKICAIGLHCSRWITSHGFALNANNNLDEFSYIVPCGITDKQVTSIENEIGDKIDLSELKTKLITSFSYHFGKCPNENQ